MLPKVEGIESLEALLRTRRELLFARFRELWTAERDPGHALRGGIEQAGDPLGAEPLSASPSRRSICHSSMRLAPSRS